MTGFLDLPIELLPLILQYIIRPSHIAALCLVNRYFHAFAISQLYQRAFIYAWHTDGKTKVSILYKYADKRPTFRFLVKVIQLFNTLTEHPHLARYVRQLGTLNFVSQ